MDPANIQPKYVSCNIGLLGPKCILEDLSKSQNISAPKSKSISEG